MAASFWVKQPGRVTRHGNSVHVYLRAESSEAAEEGAAQAGPDASILIMDSPDPSEERVVRVEKAPPVEVEDMIADLEGRLTSAGFTDRQMIDEVAKLWNAANGLADAGQDAEHIWQQLIDKLLGGRGVADEVIEPVLPRLLALAVKGTTG